MSHLYKYYIILFAIIIAAGCSKLVDDIPPAPVLKTHETGIKNPNSPNFHGNLIRMYNWDLNKCQQCHGGDYSGGITDGNCLNCHEETGGPEACNTCHGDFDDPSRIAPPRDISQDTLTTTPGVGAHVEHLYTNDLGNQIACTNCHKVPQNYFDAGHTDSDLPAEIIFGEIAIVNNGIDASYNYSSATCSDTYCHGNWTVTKDPSDTTYWFAFDVGSNEMKGNNVSVIWNQVDGTQAKCGSCHGVEGVCAAPLGHIGYNISVFANSCGRANLCHPGIVDNNGNIIDTEKHINGVVNVAGN